MIAVRTLVSLDPLAFTPVYPPPGVVRYRISARGKLPTDVALPTLLVRTTATDASTEFAVWSGEEFSMEGDAAALRASFSPGQPAFYVKPESGTGGHRIFWS